MAWAEAANRGGHVKRLNGMDAYLLYTETPSLHSVSYTHLTLPTILLV